MEKHLLKFDGASKTYRGGAHALAETSLEVGCGIFGLLGPNGAGKTTLLRLAATLLAPSEGAVSFDGLDSVRDRKRYRAHLGYLPQTFGLYPGMTAREHLLYFASLKGVAGKAAREEADRLLADVGLQDDLDRPVGAFSGGMRQRVGIAGALVGSPRLVVVDEPTAGLDPEERMRFRGVLERVARDAVVVLSTHILQDVELGCSRVAVVASGRLLADAAPDELAALARGRVWTLDATPAQLDELRRVRTVTAARRLPDGAVRTRFVGEPTGCGEAPAEPRLEDAYVDLMARHRRDGGTW